MSNVIDILSRKPHLAGAALCLGCKHTWEAVEPVGTVSLECPECGTDRGVMAGLAFPKDGAMVWTCNNDDNTLFTKVVGQGWLCVVCGATQTNVDDDS